MRIISSLVLLLFIISCTPKGSEAIKLNSDGCEFCKMKIADGKFGAEIITVKGRVYKFDDMHCMLNYHKENSTTQIHSFFIHDYNQNNVLIPAENALYVKGGDINSPMHGNIIAIKSEKEAIELAKKFNANPVSWQELIK